MAAIYHAIHLVTGDMAKKAFGPLLTRANLDDWAAELEAAAEMMRKHQP